MADGQTEALDHIGQAEMQPGGGSYGTPLEVQAVDLVSKATAVAEAAEWLNETGRNRIRCFMPRICA